MNALKIGFLFSLAFLIGCGGERLVEFPLPNPATDTTPPTVIRTNPANFATGVPLNKIIRATFSEAMDSASVNSSTFKLLKNDADKEITGTVSYFQNVATFTPFSPFEYGTTYVATIATGAKDLAQNQMKNPYSWRFTTENKSDNVCPLVDSIAPRNGTVNFSLSGIIIVRFSEPMNRNSVSRNFCLEKLSGERTSGSFSFSNDSAIFTFYPDALDPNAAYLVKINRDAKDIAGNSLCETFVSTFATSEAPDNVCPHVISVDPADGAVDIPFGINVIVVLSEPINPETVTSQSFFLKQGATDIPGAISFENDATILVLNPANDLEPETTYAAEITTGVKDPAGNSLCEARVWTFVTESEPDNNCPMVSFVEPENGALNVLRSTDILIRFNEKMNTATLNRQTIILNVGEGHLNTEGVISFLDNGQTAILNPDVDLIPNATYLFKVTTGAKDIAGNALCGIFSSTFTTEEITDANPPYVTQTTPRENATDILREVLVKADFSEPMDSLSLNYETFELRNPDGRKIPGRVDYVNGATNAAIFAPDQLLSYGARYDAKITTGVRDKAGNHMTAPYAWHFTIMNQPDETCPTWISFSPPSNATDVSPETEIVVTLSERVDPGTVWSQTFFLKRGETNINASISNENGVVLKLRPENNLDWNTTYRATLTRGVKDLVGNPLCEELAWSFTTASEPDNACPSITSLNPPNGATNVSLGTDIVLNLSESIDPGTVTSQSFYLMRGATQVSGTFSFSQNNTRVTLSPTTNLNPLTAYVATVTNDVKDPSGNRLCNPQSWSFTTESLPDGDCPRVTVVEPPDNAQGVSLDKKPAVRFGEAMDPASIPGNFTLKKQNGNAVEGTIAFSEDNAVATFDPLGNLDAATVYVLRVTREAKDVAGNRLCEEFVSTFTTGSEPVSPLPLNLASVAPYAILATAVHNSGTSAINGNLGTSPGTEITGFPPGIVNGETHAGDAYSYQAWLDMRTAYNDVAGRSANVVVLDGELGGLNLPTGLYKATSFNITTGDMTLNARGDPDAVWIFQVPSGTLNLGANRRVVLANSAQAKNVFWQINGSASLGTNSIFEGNILTEEAITLSNGVRVNGRALSKRGTVTLNANTVNRP